MKRIKENMSYQGILFSNHYVGDRLAEDDEVFLFDRLIDKLDRIIEDDGYLIYRKEMRTKMQQEDSKKIYSKRSGSVEPVFGQIKNNRGFTRFRLRGLLKIKNRIFNYGYCP